MNHVPALVTSASVLPYTAHSLTASAARLPCTVHASILSAATLVRLRASAIVLGAVALALFTTSAFGQADGPASGLDLCASELVGYRDWTEAKDQEWHFTQSVDNGGAIYYFGASHSDDPSHPQFDEIEAAYTAFGPTVVFYEGPERPLEDSRDSVITRYGESGFARYLASLHGAAVKRLEPSPIEEMNHVLAAFTAEQATLFYVLREASRFRERKDMDRKELRDAISELLARAGSMMDLPIKTIDDLQAAYAKYWEEPAEWWQAPTRWFTPGDASEETGGIFTNDVNRVSSEFRNRHMYEVLARDVLAGERVFAVVGRNLVPMQAPALACALMRVH